MGRATLAPNHDVTVLQPNARVAAGNQRDVAVVTGEALEFSRQSQTMAFGDPTSGPDVLARPVVLAAPSSLPCERSQAIDALLGNTHTGG